MFSTMADIKCAYVYVIYEIGASLVAQTVKNLPANVGDPGWILRSERSLGEGNGNPLQFSCLGNSMERRAWEAIVHGVTKNESLTLHPELEIPLLGICPLPF